MILQSSLKGTLYHVKDNLIIYRDSNQHPNRYQADLIHNNNNMFNSQNDNSNNNVHDHIDDSLSHIFSCGSKHCQFQNNVSGTATNRLYKCNVPYNSRLFL